MKTPAGKVWKKKGLLCAVLFLVLRKCIKFFSLFFHPYFHCIWNFYEVFFHFIHCFYVVLISFLKHFHSMFLTHFSYLFKSISMKFFVTSSYQLSTCHCFHNKKIE